MCRMDELPPAPPLLSFLCPYVSRPVPYPALPSLCLQTPLHVPLYPFTNLFKNSKAFFPNLSLLHRIRWFQAGKGCWVQVFWQNTMDRNSNTMTLLMLLWARHMVLLVKRVSPLKQDSRGWWRQSEGLSFCVGLWLDRVVAVVRNIPDIVCSKYVHLAHVCWARGRLAISLN